MQSLNALPNFSLQPADGVTAWRALGFQEYAITLEMLR
jgi:hypothetical protein